MDNDIVVETRDLTKRYGDFTALDSMSIKLKRGRILGFIGPNGAGKTTCIRILVGLSKPSSGEAIIDGHDCTSDSKQIKKLVGYMPDTFGSYDNMRVHEYLDFFGAAFKIPRNIRGERINHVTEVTLSSYMRDLYVESLSHGMKQRIGIARTLLHDPAVIILDEPANGLDPNARIELRQVLLRLAKMGKTLIVTSHILPELSRICDTVAIINKGKLRAFGTLDEVMLQVHQRRMVEIEVLEPAKIDTLIDLLKKHLEPDAEINPSRQEGQVRVSTDADNQQLSKILSAAVNAGLGIAQFHEVPLDLEDAFMTITERDAKPEVAPEPEVMVRSDPVSS